MAQTASYRNRSEQKNDGKFLYTKDPPLEEAIQARLSLDSSHNIWQLDIPTSDVVVYIPGEVPMFIPGKAMKSAGIKVVDYRKDEFYVGQQFIGRFWKRAYPFTICSKWVETKGLDYFFSQLGIDYKLTEKYERRLTSANIDRVQIYPLSKTWVNSHKKPFIRQICLMGIRETNYNKGGICADSPPTLRAA